MKLGVIKEGSPGKVLIETKIEWKWIRIPKETQTVYTNKRLQFLKCRNKEEWVIWCLKVTIEEYFFPKPKTNDNQEHNIT